MYESFDKVTLKNGETVTAAVVRTPEPQWTQTLRHLLGHKGDVWRWHIESALEGTGDVETYFYILHRDGEPLANIMTAEYKGVGMLGHVYTAPQDRRKGASSALFDYLIPHFRSRGGKAMILGTAYDTPPWHLYRKYGFEAVEEGSGYMSLYCDGHDAFSAEYYAGKDLHVGPLAWEHWPSSAPLCVGDFNQIVRCAPFRIIGRVSSEYGLLDAMRRQMHSGQTQVSVLADNTTGGVLGLAACSEDPTFKHMNMVDVFCHPNHWDRAGEMLSVLPVSKGPLVAYADDRCAAKLEALKAAGFREMGELPKHVPTDVRKTGFADVTILRKD